MNGAGAQEENLFRRTNYYQHLEHPKQANSYPMYGSIYSPDVIVFRYIFIFYFIFLNLF